MLQKAKAGEYPPFSFLFLNLLFASIKNSEVKRPEECSSCNIAKLERGSKNLKANWLLVDTKAQDIQLMGWLCGRKHRESAHSSCLKDSFPRIEEPVPELCPTKLFPLDFVNYWRRREEEYGNKNKEVEKCFYFLLETNIFPSFCFSFNPMVLITMPYWPKNADTALKGEKYQRARKPGLKGMWDYIF